MKKLKIILLILSTCLIAIFLFQAIDTATVTHTPATTTKKITHQPVVEPALQNLLTVYEAEIKKLMTLSGIPGVAIAVVKDSSIIYMKGLGVKMINSHDSIDANTIFRIASVSKSFSSFLTGMLVADGIVHWDDPIINYVPQFSLKSKAQTTQLTFRHVLSHTTGLPYHTYTNLVEAGIPLTDLLGKLKDIDIARPVGQEYSYQNVVFSVVGEALQGATHKPFDLLMKERVFSPLGMSTASMDYHSIMTNTNVARPHKMRHGKMLPTTINNTYYNVAPAGGINASINDMAHWMIALLGNRKDVIKEETLQQVFTPQVKAPSKNKNYGRTQRVSQSYYGLGWRILHYPSDTLVYHGGYVNGYRSEVALDPHEKIAVCILTNAPGMVADKGIPIFFNLIHEMEKGIPFTSEPDELVDIKKIAVDSLN